MLVRPEILDARGQPIHRRSALDNFRGWRRSLVDPGRIGQQNTRFLNSAGVPLMGTATGVQVMETLGTSESGNDCCCSSSSGTCFNPSGSSGCGANCVDASLPSSVVVDLTPLTVCPTGCQALPTSITMYNTGTCANPFSPRFLGEDPSGKIVAFIQWDPDNTCFVFYVEGDPSAPTGCQVIMWVGYGGAGNPTGTYTRACGGGCDANSSVLTLTVS